MSLIKRLKRPIQKSRSIIRKRSDLSSEKEQANEPYQAVKEACAKEKEALFALRETARIFECSKKIIGLFFFAECRSLL